ncbi:Hypothetical predicted protein [Pelobates cultripes]|uniref:Uncharacterized protein n=1 Tax=Pelobates cultripes TaxID=61616 RepID=A0AAD1S625_PELCU|nr:Hypothetical predicted protein [Pelobates cultripes]
MASRVASLSALQACLCLSESSVTPDTDIKELLLRLPSREDIAKMLVDLDTSIQTKISELGAGLDSLDARVQQRETTIEAHNS